MSGGTGANDPHDLQRFVEAQSRDYARALGEIRSGAKRSHWMWYVFPQCDGLGHSATARRFAISSVAEAKAYLGHPVLGPRLIEAAEAVLAVEGRSAYDIFGPDDVKLQSSATLFAHVSPADSPFRRILLKFFAGKPDRRTLELIGADREGTSAVEGDGSPPRL
jgi:uncharacterized protein (DUF1810 family)